MVSHMNKKARKTGIMEPILRAFIPKV